MMAVDKTFVASDKEVEVSGPQKRGLLGLFDTNDPELVKINPRKTKDVTECHIR